MKRPLKDHKLEAFVGMARSAGQRNDKLSRAWYRGLPRRQRDETSNAELVKLFMPK